MTVHDLLLLAKIPGIDGITWWYVSDSHYDNIYNISEYTTLLQKYILTVIAASTDGLSNFVEKAHDVPNNGDGARHVVVVTVQDVFLW